MDVGELRTLAPYGTLTTAKYAENVKCGTLINVLQKADCMPTLADAIGATTTLDASQTFATNGLDGTDCPK